MTSTELMSILSKQWANVNDIKKIASCGRDNASYVRDNIALELKKKGYHLPMCKEILVPMESVIKYFNLNIEHISLMAEKEKILVGGKSEKKTRRQ